MVNQIQDCQQMKRNNGKSISFPSDKCIHELIEQQVTKTPDAIALLIEGQSLTYNELNTQANRLARYLLELGVKPETRVALCMPHSFELMVALLAILKSGGAYVPLDPSYPADRLMMMIEDCQPLMVLTQSCFSGLLPNIKQLHLDDDSAWQHQATENLECASLGLTARHLAYVIYTSGSTGKPKGVMIEHRNMVHFLSSSIEKPSLSSSDTVLAFSTIAFDIAATELLMPLVVGAKIVLIKPEDAVNPSVLKTVIDETDITMMQATPARWQLLLNGGWQGSKRMKAWCGGEGLNVKFADELAHYFGELWNMYGPTETTVAATCLRVDDKRPKLSVYESIGRPLANTEVYILNEQLQEVDEGELYIGGEGVGRGYFNRPDLTEERFIPNPFSTEPNAKLYKTGDLVRWLDDGNIEFLGRDDFQVKIRGFRIELGDIETKLTEHPKIAQVAVIAREDFNSEKRLIAYLILKENNIPSIHELRNFLKEKLPVFMIPSAFVFLDSFPLTPNGKLDRKALPEPDYQQLSHNEFISPETDIEKQLANIWCDILSIRQIGINDNFFDLGGNSLLVVNTVVELNKHFNIELPFGIIYQFPTIKQLSNIIESGNLSSAWYSLVPIQTQGSRPPLFAIHTISLSDLPRYLKDQPLYFLRYGMARENQNNSITLPELSDLAKHYIDEMRHIQPQGPYHLIGFSFGGILAYEMACQLTASGQRVNFIGLLDSYLEREKLPQSFKQIICKIFNQSPIQLYKRIAGKLQELIETKSLETDNNFSPHIYTEAPDKACMTNYHPHIYQGGQVTLFQGFEWDTLFSNYQLPEYAWRKLLGDKLDIQYVSGAHLDLLKEPHVKILAQALNACMDKAICVENNRIKENSEIPSCMQHKP